MSSFPIFLSVVLVVRNINNNLNIILNNATELLKTLVSDYEIIVVDNASDDNSLLTLKKMTGQDGLPNIQVFALTKEVDADTASWVGLENALGDFVAVVDPLTNDLSLIPLMLDKAMEGNDVVFADNKTKIKQGLAYESANVIFQKLYKLFNGVNLAKDAPHYRLINRSVINFILQHPQPVITYRHLPATGGFSKANIEYNSKPLIKKRKSLADSFDRGMRLLVSTTRIPMRLVTGFSLFGAIANLVYSLYIIIILLLKDDVAQGWASISLQISGMFFLLSLVLLVLGEYILHMASLSNEGPLYHIGQEFTSEKMTRKEKLNIEDVSLSAK
ncbi:MAG TPA: glycosyltransferase [Arsenophonus nasoniae]|uniref:glycosyltransferase n=1 Tax=Arsenophonus nasoniae TaxID=638 RepID=UPI00387A4441